MTKPKNEPQELPDTVLDAANGAGETRNTETLAFVFHKIENKSGGDPDRPVITGRL